MDCVFLTCFEDDANFFASILTQSGIRIHPAATLDSADFLLLITAATVLIVDPTFLDGDWQDALDMLARFHPLVAPILCADRADYPFIAHAQSCGIQRILWRPVELDTLRTSIRAAHEITLERRLWQASRSLEGQEMTADRPSTTALK